MQEFKDLTEEQQVSVLATAAEWKENHFNHIKSLVKDKKYAIAPSGIDMFHPELWKGIHWIWFNDKKVNV